MFEIEVLERLKSAKLLDGLVFGGGTMLRLCYDLNRYSTDLDFWFVKKVEAGKYLSKARDHLSRDFEITDFAVKYYSALLELRSPRYPKRLKIEIRKSGGKGDFQERIAFSQYDTRQVVLRVFTLEEIMKRKIGAALDRKDIRDFFDLEFLLRKGIKLVLIERKKEELSKTVRAFKPRDFKVGLGSLLDSDTRQFYVNNGFSYLLSKLV
ncbi:MAG: nucleotidyl transferase AbiEii/AbiGii toxin family protein [Candidatus Omnitrophica bacterium]|nr:nucleotidyl transferase AbiEii/AbiGii toxin family protein [Candidatus Omnitrophota bacterium]